MHEFFVMDNFGHYVILYRQFQNVWFLKSSNIMFFLNMAYLY